MRPKIIKNIDESFFESDCDNGMKNPRSVFSDQVRKEMK